MATHSLTPEAGEPRTPRPPAPAARPAGPSEVATEFSARLALAENTNLRERLGRLEASIAFWAADVDEANEEKARLRGLAETLKGQLHEARGELDAFRKERAAMHEALTLRDAHIADLEARVVTHEMGDIDARRTRSRLVSVWKRIRARHASQAEELEGLRRKLVAGHAARLQVEEELRQAQTDAVRNARYLDRLEQRLAQLKAAVEARG